jgi:hypothetical protein
MSQRWPHLLLVLGVVSAVSTFAHPAVCHARSRQRRLAVLIGNNLGHLPARKLRWAERDAQKLHRALVEVGGFKPADVWALLGKRPAQVRRALRQAEARAKALRSRGVRTLLFIYFSGHADGRVLELGPASLPYGELRKLLERSRAHVRLAMIDSCKSGAFLRAKGGKRRRRAWRLRVDDELRSRGYAVITSSAANELSQESAELRGSFFTHHLVSGLRGAADHSRDRRVTLAELYRHVYARTVAATSATIGGSQHPMYAFKLAGRGDLVLGRLRRPGSAALAVAGSLRGRLLVLDGAGKSMVAEVDLDGSAVPRRARRAPRLLALRPGRYRIYLQRPNGSLGEVRLELASGQRAKLGDRSFGSRRLALAVSKGGLFSANANGVEHGAGLRSGWLAARPHRLHAGLLLRRMPLSNVGLGLGAALRYELLIGDRWQLGARFGWTTAGDAGVSAGLHDLLVSVGGGPRLALLERRLELQTSAMLGYGHLLQSPRDGQTRHSSALVYQLRLGAVLALVANFELALEGAVGGRLFQLREASGDSALTHRLELSTLLSLGRRF